MLDIRRDQPGFFSQGIESISHASTTQAFSLPASTNAPLSEAGVRSHLEALLQKPSMDSRLDAALRPPLANRDLLLPGNFRAALGAARELLRQAALQRQAAARRRDPRKPGEAEASQEFPVLNRAARLLDEDAADRDLGQMYRSTLYQG
ncbi:hypothetical protein [Comamonas endophytica]|uniref:Uncharacterized protein n=1 Tax=Comamonas endophytica TaxID=2949090 RepID=A0ABY6GCH9_9BURK|nr:MULTISPECIES: hypothetical protein [unclassified Acidovorax]MCD2512851.1 hypothetical protein [Acidovorax sp. D4N7]UYG52801.1 hypothetical protein M9799_06055 [Acidovorax sp. 5MLIR]